MTMQLIKATQEKCKLRMILIGLPGTGKTYSALNIAKDLVPDGKVMLLDSEYGSARKYAKKFDFYTWEVTNHDPRNYVKLLKEAEGLGVDVIIIDSISHAWHKLLEIADEGKGSGPFGGWGKAAPIHKEFVEAILASKCHVIATARAKADYVDGKDERGKNKKIKVGVKAEQKENVEYEFDVAGELEPDNTLTITKSRCSEIHRKTFHQPGKELAKTLSAWLNDGAAPTAPVVDASVAEFEIPAGKEPVFDAADATATLLDFCKANAIPDKYLSTYLKKKFNDVVTEEAYNQALKDLDRVVDLVLAADGGKDDPTEVLKSAFRSVCQ